MVINDISTEETLKTSTVLDCLLDSPKISLIFQEDLNQHTSNMYEQLLYA